MVSRKRLSYVHLPDVDSSGSEDTDTEYIPKGKLNKNININRNVSESNSNGNDIEKRTTRRQKCFSRNALMARENRLKKKRYLQGLEKDVSKLKHENKSLKSILSSQSQIITDLRKEVKYMKSIVANSTDLMRLMKTINSNTGMSVTTSLDKALTLKNNYVSKNEVVRGKTAHPWEESNSPLIYSPSIEEPDMNMDFLLSDPILTEISVDHLDDVFNMNQESSPSVEPNHVNSEFTFKEHNYTTRSSCDEEVGICLHVSKHKVSLEFCSSCSENASQAWAGIE